MKNETSLGDIATVVMGQAPPGETYNTTGDGLPFFQGKAEFGDDFPTAVKWCTAPSRVAETGDILLSVRAPVGPTNIAQERCCIGRGLAAIRAQEGKALTRYLRYFFCRFESAVARRGVGSTFAAINRNDIESLRLACPPLGEQEHIVRILDEADELRRLRAQADSRTADLLPAIFDEMFGNHQFPLKTVSEVAKRVVVGHVGPTTEGYSDKGIPFLRTQNVRRLFINREDLRYITPEFNRTLKKSKLCAGDVLVSRVGVNRGMAAVVPDDLNGANCANVLVVTPKQEMISEYLAFLINSPLSQRDLIGVSVGSAQGVINTTSLQNWRIKVPPYSLQIKFARIVQRFERLRAQQREATRQAEHLFQTLLHRAFRGEL